MNLNIRRGQYGWSASASTENRDTGEKNTAFLDIKFAKCAEPIPSNCQIKVKYGFLGAFHSTKKDLTIPQIVVMEYELIKEYESKETEKPSSKEKVEIDTETDNLPF